MIILRTAKFRNGRKVRRTLYIQRGSEPEDSDPVVGLVDTPELAELIVKAVNDYLLLHPGAKLEGA